MIGLTVFTSLFWLFKLSAHLVGSFPFQSQSSDLILSGTTVRKKVIIRVNSVLQGEVATFVVTLRICLNTHLSQQCPALRKTREQRSDTSAAKSAPPLIGRMKDRLLTFLLVLCVLKRWIFYIRHCILWFSIICRHQPSLCFFLKLEQWLVPLLWPGGSLFNPTLNT